MLRWTRRRWAFVSVVIVAVAAVGLFAPTIIGGWAPALHLTCQRGRQVTNETVQIPGLLVNSPYGGHAWGNVTYPLGFLPDDLVGESTTDSNGGAAWAGFQARITVTAVENATDWGAGANRPCVQPFEVGVVPIGNPSLGIPIMGQGNMSDRQEPDVAFPGQSNAISFDNGFDSANSANVSTCGQPAESLPLVISTFLTLSAHFADGGVNRTATFNVPLVDSQYHYTFPSNFGTWQVANLSVDGGPGGGWAFSYYPCP